MERLTMTSPQGGVAFTFDLDVTCEKSEMLKILKLAERLKQYEDAAEQGLLLKLPCKVGDTVYRVYLDGEYTVSWWSIKEDKFTLSYYEKYKDEFGKMVFTTKEEAKAKLAEMEGK